MKNILYKLIYGSKNSPLIATLLIVAIFLFVSSVYAWILFNDKVSNGDVNGGIEYDPIKATYEIYHKDQEGATQLIVGFPNDGEDPIEMHTYDSVFVQKNQFNPIIVRIIIESPDLEDACQDGSTKTLTVSITKKTIADTNDAHGNAWKDSYYFSSVMNFAAMVEPRNIDLSGNDQSDKNNIYNAGYSALFDPVNGTTDPTPVFKNSVTTKSFVKDASRPAEAAATNTDKSEEITLQVTYTKDDFRIIDNTDVKKLVVYVAINYDRELLINSHFIATNLSQGLDIIAVEFYSDLEIMTLREN